MENPKKINVIYLILMISIFVLLLFLFLISFYKGSKITEIFSIIIGASTFLYTVFTGVTIFKLNEQNELTKNSINNAKKLEEDKKRSTRKNIALNLILELQDNKYLLDALVDYTNSGGLILEKGNTKIFKVMNTKFLDNIYNIYISKFIDVGFEDDNLTGLIRKYYNKINEIKNIAIDFKKIPTSKSFDTFRSYLFSIIGEKDEELINQNLYEIIIEKLEKIADFKLKKSELERHYIPYDL